MKGPECGHVYRSHLRGKPVVRFTEKPEHGESGWTGR